MRGTLSSEPTTRGFKPYPEYKDSGIEWLGQIPKHWQVQRAKTVEKNASYLVQTGPFGAQLHASDYLEHTEEGIPLILIKNVNNLVIAHEDLPRISQENAIRLSEYRVKARDIVFTRVGSVGRIGLVTEEESGWLISGQMLRLRFLNSNLLTRYAIYAISSDSVLAYFDLMSVGTTRDSINTTILRDMPLPLPTVNEQHAIAAFLDRETAKIEALIAKKERLIELLKEKRTALITQAVTKGLDPNVPTKDSGVEWLGKIPAHWKTEQNRRLFRESDHRSEYGDEELLTVSHITGVTRHSEKNVTMIEAESHEGYKICRYGELVINTMWAWMGALGIAWEAGMVSPSYNVYVLNSGVLIPRYYDFLCRVPIHVSELTKLSKGIWKSRLRLYPDGFYNISSPTPPIAEQKRIANFIDTEVGTIDVLAREIKLAIERLKEYRTALISAAVTGKIDVRGA